MVSIYRYITTAILLFLILLTVVTVLPTASSPVLLTSPDTTSMEPEITPTDLVIIQSSSSYSPEDIVLYEDEDVSQPILHRIVSETQEGYITQGDANSVTDQESGLDPVTEDQILGKVLSINDSPVVIPYVGILYSNTEILLLGWIILTLFTLLGSNVKREHYESHTKRGELQIATAIVILSCIGVVIVTILFPVVESPSFLVTQNPTQEDLSVVSPGESGEDEIIIENPLKIFTTVYAESDSDQISATSVEREDYDTTVITLENKPQEQIGVVTGDVRIYTYVRILPRPFIYTLAGIHPLLASIATISVLGSSLLLVLQFLIDPKQPPRMSKNKIRELRNSR